MPHKPIVRRFDTDEDWLAARKHFVGASEVSTLFGCGYETYYTMWHQKKGLIPETNLDDVLPVIVGDCMEAGLADVIRRVHEFQLRKSHRYLIHPDTSAGLASTLDYEILTGDAGWVPCELKIQDWMAFSDDWEETERSGEYDPPLKFALQLQAQLRITDKPYGYLFCLVGNRQLVKVRMEADEEIGDLIVQKCAEFWASIDANEAPDPAIDEDLSAMAFAMANKDDGREIHMHGDPAIEIAVQSYAQAAQREKNAKALKDDIKRQIMQVMGPAIRLKCTNGGASFKTTDQWGNDRRVLRITPSKAIKESFKE